MKILDTVRSWFGGKTETRGIAGSDSWIVSPTLSGVYVNEDTVLTIGAYYAGVGVLASDVSSIPFQVVKKQADGSIKVDETHPNHELVFCDPDPDEPEMSAMAWVASQMWHLNTVGNSYSRIHRDKYFRPTGLTLLDPAKVEPKRSSYGKLYYDLLGEKVLPGDILHVAALGYDGILGRSPIRQARETLGLTMAAEKFGASYFGNGINSGGAISIPQTLDEVETKAFRAGINREHQGPYNANKFMLLQGGATFVKTTIEPDDAQFLLTRKFQLAEICRILRLPPTKMQDFDKASFSNIEEVNQDYYTSSLKPWLKRFQAEFNRKLFTRDERRIWRIDHDVTEILKGRMVDQANVDKIYLDEGVINRDEVRARHGLGPIKGGKTYFVPLNMAPLDKVAEASIETLKGVKSEPKGPSASVPTDAIDTPALVADGAEVKSLRAAFTVAAGRILVGTAKRMARREANAVRKIARRRSIAEIITGLEEFYAGEPATLAEAFDPALALYRLISDDSPTPAALAAELVTRSNAELLKAIEGPDSTAAILALADAWEADRPSQVLDRLKSHERT